MVRQRVDLLLLLITYSCNTWLELSQKCPLCLRYTTKLNVHTLYISTESSPKLDNTDLKKVVELFKANQSEYKKLLKEAKVTNKQLVSEIKAHKLRTSRSSRLLQHVVEYVFILFYYNLYMYCISTRKYKLTKFK